MCFCVSAPLVWLMKRVYRRATVLLSFDCCLSKAVLIGRACNYHLQTPKLHTGKHVYCSSLPWWLAPSPPCLFSLLFTCGSFSPPSFNIITTPTHSYCKTCIFLGTHCLFCAVLFIFTAISCFFKKIVLNQLYNIFMCIFFLNLQRIFPSLWLFFSIVMSSIFISS